MQKEWHKATKPFEKRSKNADTIAYTVSTVDTKKKTLKKYSF
jgi:hypothetical protein